MNDYRRFEDWSRGGQSPAWLTEEHWPAIVGSPAHFARKFDSRAGALLDRIDRERLGI